jgi:hypothetical protein
VKEADGRFRQAELAADGLVQEALIEPAVVIQLNNAVDVVTLRNVPEPLVKLAVLLRDKSTNCTVSIPQRAIQVEENRLWSHPRVELASSMQHHLPRRSDRMVFLRSDVRWRFSRLTISREGSTVTPFVNSSIAYGASSGTTRAGLDSGTSSANRFASR